MVAPLRDVWIQPAIASVTSSTSPAFLLVDTDFDVCANFFGCSAFNERMEIQGSIRVVYVIQKCWLIGLFEIKERQCFQWLYTMALQLYLQYNCQGLLLF